MMRLIKLFKLVNMTVGRLTDSISPRWTEKNVRKIGYYIHAGYILSNKYSAAAHICDKNGGWSASKITIVLVWADKLSFCSLVHWVYLQ